MSKYKLDKSAQVVENPNYRMTQEEVCERLNDLEAKLAESEKSKEINIKERDKICLEMATDYNKEIMQLKQQLSEKEKQVNTYAKEIVFLDRKIQEKDKEISVLKSQLCLSVISQSIDQDKISFAVEQLEKVKEIISFKPPMQTYEEIIKTFMFRIDNQIKQLKEKNV